MSWGRWDDRAPFHRKWIGLSNDAVAMGWRAVTWARSPEAKARPGFVTERELRALSGGITRRRFLLALEELLTAGAPAHEHGILVRTEGGFEIHDFEDYGAPAREPGTTPTIGPEPARPKMDRKEAARVAGQASAAARRAANGTAQPGRTSSNVVPNVTERRSTEQRSNEQRQPVERTPVSPEPDPERSSAFGQDAEVVPLERRSGSSDAHLFGEWDRQELTEYPDGLFEHARDAGIFRHLAAELDVDVWDVEAVGLGFKFHWTTGPGAHGRRPRWLTKLRAWILDKHSRGEVAGVGVAPGAAEHAARTGRSRSMIEAPGAARERGPSTLAQLIRPPARTAAELDAQLAAVPPKKAEGAE